MHRRITTALAVGLACCAPIAAASYAQMTLPGLAADILFVLIAAYALVVDVVLLCKGFRSRASVIVAVLISLVLVLGLLAERHSVEAAFDNLAWNWQVMLLGASIVLVPLTILVAPVAQHLELHRQRPHRAVWVAIAVHALLAGIAVTLTYFDDHPLESTRAEWKDLRKRGEQVAPGEVAVLRDAFDKRHSWGSLESLHLLKGIESSALIHGGAPLSPEDRKALAALLERDRAAARPKGAGAHYYGFIEAKLLWDTLEPGSVDRSIPRGKALPVVYMLEFIDRHGPQRLCSVDGLADADRAALTRALTSGRGTEVLAKVTHALDRLDEACGAARRIATVSVEQAHDHRRVLGDGRSGQVQAPVVDGDQDRRTRRETLATGSIAFNSCSAGRLSGRLRRFESDRERHAARERPRVASAHPQQGFRIPRATVGPAGDADRGIEVADDPR